MKFYLYYYNKIHAKVTHQSEREWTRMNTMNTSEHKWDMLHFITMELSDMK